MGNKKENDHFYGTRGCQRMFVKGSLKPMKGTRVAFDERFRKEAGMKD